MARNATSGRATAGPRPCQNAPRRELDQTDLVAAKSAAERDGVRCASDGAGHRMLATDRFWPRHAKAPSVSVCPGKVHGRPLGCCSALLDMEIRCWGPGVEGQMLVWSDRRSATRAVNGWRMMRNLEQVRFLHVWMLHEECVLSRTELRPYSQTGQYGLQHARKAVCTIMQALYMMQDSPSRRYSSG